MKTLDPGTASIGTGLASAACAPERPAPRPGSEALARAVSEAGFAEVKP